MRRNGLQKEHIMLIDFINEIAPTHGRTSCSDENSNGNEFFNESGNPRCTRCAMLHRAKHGSWPHNATVVDNSLTFKFECLE